MEILGIDIGGSGIKGATVDTDSGRLTAERYRIPTPEPAKPDGMAGAVAEVVQHFNWHGPIGCGFPAPIRHGVAMTAANIHKKWIGTNVAALFAQVTSCPVSVLNDADAAGIAEMTFGAGQNLQGVVMIITIGTGLGSAIFTNRHLLPNTELGHLEFKGYDAESRASDAARKRDDLSWEKWVGRLDAYLRHVEGLFWPDLIILGGGVSRKFDLIKPLLTVKSEVVPALLLNDAGLVGAALAARGLLT